MAPSRKWFVVGSLLCSESFFSGYSGFSSSLQKPAVPNSNSNRNQVDEQPLCGCAPSKSLFYNRFLFIYVYSNSLLAILAVIVSKE